MSNTPNRTSNKPKTPLASLRWLKHLGIVGAILSLYIIGLFYYRYAEDIFPKSLSIGQLLRLSFLSLASQLLFIIIPLLFFSGALVYRSVRQNGLNPLMAIKRDLLIILPLGVLLWVYGAFYESSVNTKFYAMIFEVQQLEPGEKLVEDSNTSDLLKEPNIRGLIQKIDTLDFQIEDAEERFVNQLSVLVPRSKLDELVPKLDFGPISIEPEDVRRSPRYWDGIERDIRVIQSYSSGMVNYIESFTNQQSGLRDQVRVIFFTPLYVMLFLLFGLLLGYCIPIHKAALMAILIAIAYTWYASTNVLQVLFGGHYSNQSWFVLGKIGVLLIVNITLLIVANRAYKGIKSTG